jgi:hypothetical protein
MFHGQQCGSAWDIFMIYQQWAAVISSISRLFSAAITEQCVPSWCGILRSNVYFCMTPTLNTDLVGSGGEYFDVNFVLKKFLADKQFTI